MTSDASIYVVYTDVPADREDEFNRWYNEVHVPDLLKLDCVVGAQRFKLNGGGVEMRMRDGSLQTPRYLTIYHLNTTDEEVIRRQVDQARPGWIEQGRWFAHGAAGPSVLVPITDRYRKA